MKEQAVTVGVVDELLPLKGHGVWGSLRLRGAQRSPAAGKVERLGERRRVSSMKSPPPSFCGLLLAQGAYPFIEAD